MALSGRRTAIGAGVVVALAAVLLTVGIAGGTPSGPSHDGAAQTSGSTTTGNTGDTASTDLLAKDINKQQTRLKTVPGDWTSWASLGADYVQQARISADPSYYAKADGALAQSLKIYPRGNFLALTVKASLAAARHDFAGALELADQSLAIDSYNSTTYGVRGDALDELGRYDEALASFTKMDHLRPSTSSFSRLSYAYELRGDIPRATSLLERALADAPSPSDGAYASYYLGELAWNAGNLPVAKKRYQQSVLLDANYVPALEGVAKVKAAQGDTAGAISDYQQVVDRLPQPQYVIEYGELLTSVGQTKKAAAQYALVKTEEQLFQAQGVNVDLELSLFEADHGDPAGALKSASAEYARRHSTLVEDAYAWALHVNGRDAEALPHATAALHLGTRSALFYYHRGIIEKALGMKASAVKDLQAALRLNPHFSFLQAPDAHRALAQLGAM